MLARLSLELDHDVLEHAFLELLPRLELRLNIEQGFLELLPRLELLLLGLELLVPNLA